MLRQDQRPIYHFAALAVGDPCATVGQNANTVPIKVRHLRYVIAAAEHGSFRQAAERMGVHQSAVSRRIKDLEDEIGVALFIRDHGGVTLTQAGRKFLARSRKALSEIDYAAIDAEAFGRGEVGIVRIGIFSSLASGFLTELLRTYAIQNPQITLDLVEGSPTEHVTAIQRYELDVAFLTGDPLGNGCDSAQLWTERVFLALPSDHALTRNDEIRWKDLRRQHFIVSEADPGPEIHDFLVKHLSGLGHRPDIDRHEVGRDNLMHLVAIGQGLTLTSEATTATAFPGIAYRPVDEETLPFQAVWSPRNDNPAFRRFLSLAKSMARGGR